MSESDDKKMIDHMTWCAGCQNHFYTSEGIAYTEEEKQKDVRIRNDESICCPHCGYDTEISEEEYNHIVNPKEHDPEEGYEDQIREYYKNNP